MNSQVAKVSAPPLNCGVMRFASYICFPIVFLLTTAACDRAHVLTPQEIDARPLTQVDSFDAKDRDAVRAAIDRLNANGANPRDFYLTPIIRRSDGLLELHIWHRAAFEGPEVVGNPGDQSGTLVYDVTRNAIVEAWAWQ
jgi:hypothetical protein